VNTATLDSIAILQALDHTRVVCHARVTVTLTRATSTLVSLCVDHCPVAVLDSKIWEAAQVCGHLDDWATKFRVRVRD